MGHLLKYPDKLPRNGVTMYGLLGVDYYPVHFFQVGEYSYFVRFFVRGPVSGSWTFASPFAATLESSGWRQERKGRKEQNGKMAKGRRMKKTKRTKMIALPQACPTVLVVYQHSGEAPPPSFR